MKRMFFRAANAQDLENFIELTSDFIRKWHVDFSARVGKVIPVEIVVPNAWTVARLRAFIMPSLGPGLIFTTLQPIDEEPGGVDLLHVEPL